MGRCRLTAAARGQLEGGSPPKPGGERLPLTSWPPTPDERGFPYGSTGTGIERELPSS
jgi:hypothetical protein